MPPIRSRRVAVPRVLGTVPQTGERRGQFAPVPARGWSVLGWMGAAFSLIGGADLALAWYPLNAGDPEWEFGTVVVTLNNLPLFTLGMVLVLVSGLAAGRRWMVRSAATVLLLASLVLLGCAFLYATTLPMALRAPSTPLVALGLKKAIMKTGVQLVVYSTLFLWIGIQGWRSGGRRERLSS